MGVGSHQRVSHKSVGGRTSGGDNGVDEYSLVECTGYHDECLAQITHVERNDGALGITYLEAFLAEAFQSIVGHIPQSSYALGLSLDDAQSFAGGCSGSRCAAGAEDIGACGVTQRVDNGLVGSNETTDRGQ